MRTKTVSLLAILLLILSFHSCDRKELTITTSSAEALKNYSEGVELSEKFYDNEAMVKLKKAIELDSTFAMAYYYLSRVYESSGNMAGAKEMYEKALKLSGTTTPLEWMYIGAWRTILDQDYPEAIASYKNILVEYPNERHALFIIGKTYRLMKNYPESITVLERLIRNAPDYAPAYNQLGYTYYEQGNYEQAISMFSKYAEFEPNEPNPYDSMGDMLKAQGKFLEAIEQYKKALELKPDFYASFRNLGLCYIAVGQYDKALETYSNYLKMNPEREWKRDIYSDLIQLNIALGQYNRALENVEKVLEYSETPFRRSWGVAMKGHIYYLKGNYDEALKFLNASLTILPEAIWSREWRGFVFEKQGKYEQALAEAEKMKSIIEEYGLHGYQGNYSSLLGKMALAQGLYDEAIMYFVDAMKIDAFTNRYCMANAYFHKGEYEKAIAECRKIFEYNYNHAFAHLLLAQIFEKQYKKEQAVSEYKEFLRIWKNADKNLPEILMARKAIS